MSSYPDLIPKLCTILGTRYPRSQMLLDAVGELENRYGFETYRELLYLLAHLEFSAEDAHAHWHCIIAQWEKMESQLGMEVDLRVALVSYFVDVNKQLKSPKIIELQLFQETQASVYRDALTGLFNYRYFREELAREVHRCERYKSPFSVVMIDIDNFKNFNDVYGHECGNEALVGVARTIARSIRDVDTACRYGGEELVVILPSTPKTGAQIVAERIRAGVEELSLPYGKELVRTSISLGIASYPGDALDGDELIRRADTALYTAKRRGKNQVALFGDERRAHRRLDVMMEGNYRVLDPDHHPITTLDLSEGGMLFQSPKPLRPGGLLDILLKVPESGADIHFTGRVVRTEQASTQRYDVAVRIIDISQRDMLLIRDFVRSARSLPPGIGTIPPALDEGP